MWQKITYVSKGMEKGEFIHCWWESKFLQILMDVTSKIKNRTTKWSIYPTTGICLKEFKFTCQRDLYIFLFTTILFMLVKNGNQPVHPSTDEWIKKCGIYTQWNTNKPSQGRTFGYYKTESGGCYVIEISQAQIDKYQKYLHVQCKIAEFILSRAQWWLPRTEVREGGEMFARGRKVSVSQDLLYLVVILLITMSSKDLENDAHFATFMNMYTFS